LETSLSLRRIDEKDLVLHSVAFPAGAPAVAQEKQEKEDKEESRVENAGKVFKEILDAPDSIPQDILDKTDCVVILPSVLKFAIGFGGSYGRGVMTCRGGSNFNGPWGPPTMMALEGGSAGLQLGGNATDFVLLLMSPRSASSMLSSKVKLGGDVSAAAGPVGRAASAETDVALRSEILSYSRSRGLFAASLSKAPLSAPITAATINSTARRSVPATSSSNMRSQFHPAQNLAGHSAKSLPQNKSAK